MFIATKRSLCLFTVALLCTSALHAKFSFDRLATFFTSIPQEEIIHKEYALPTAGYLTLNNIKGNVTVKTEWDRNVVLLSAIRKADKAEHLSAIKIVHEHHTDEHLTINTSMAEGARGSIDYELIVPLNTALTITTAQGNVTVQHISGPLSLTTTSGAITAHHCPNKIVAVTVEDGDITMNQCAGSIKTKTNRGAVILNDVQATAIAVTQSGSISVASKLPSTADLKLQSTSGNITVQLPKNSNSKLLAKTERGTVVCEHPVTLDPVTTEVNRKTWSRLKRDVQGSLGKGKTDASVHILAGSGNIKIVNLS